jgi:hypothetical protein
MSGKTTEQYRKEFERTIKNITEITHRAHLAGYTFFDNPFLFATRDSLIGTAAQNALMAYNAGKIGGDEVLEVVERAVNACGYPTDTEE